MSIRLLLVVTCLLVLVICARADFAYELGINRGHIGNLYLDSTDIEDSYLTEQASLRYYPISQVEINLSGADTYYSDSPGLSNFLYSGQITYIPTGTDSPLLLYLSRVYDNVQYRGADFEVVDNNNSRWTASLGYKLGSAVNLRAGGRLTATRYPNSDTIDADHEKYELFAGINMSLFNANSFDIEGGVGRIDFVFIDSTVEAIPPPPWSVADSMSEGRLRSYYISPRFSRPLGLKTGLSITYTYRQFTNHDEVIIFGYSTGFLSPWASVFDGSSIMVNLKSYLVRQAIVSAGVGYWDRTYLKSLMGDNHDYPQPKNAPKRRDYFTRLYLSIQRPISFAAGGILEPTVTVDYSHNNSSQETYDYSGTTVSVGETYRR